MTHDRGHSDKAESYLKVKGLWFRRGCLSIFWRTGLVFAFPRVSVSAEWPGRLQFHSHLGSPCPLGQGIYILCTQWTVSECWRLTLSDCLIMKNAHACVHLYGSEMHSCPREGWYFIPLPYSSFSFICGDVCTHHQFLLPAWAATCGKQWRVQPILSEPHASLSGVFVVICFLITVSTPRAPEEWHETHW